ncbi:hypothetical protein MLD38_023255 [Melastoma candidum]|uniref:Uncharacterized protein n=1 Tax=Melastoma candidum TaxID=119954 RepID=A0ACB9QLY0_9MYRT|nr:hypothetical protein MLD38_023255 [Melastoma candidum]
MAGVWEVMWESLPPGFRFHPTDEEFVDHYLMNYIHSVREGICVVPTVDDLFKRDPRELPKIFRSLSIIRSKDPEWWFLSTLEYKPANSDKFDRRTSTGSWKITGNPMEIRDRVGNRLIAVKRNLVFCENQKNEKTNWVIHEYHLQDDSLGLTLREQKKYVLCHLVNRQHDYIEMSNMEVDNEYEGQQHGLSEEIIQAKMRSLTEGLSMPASNDFLTGTIFSPSADDAVCLDDMEQDLIINGGDEELQDLLKQIVFSSDEESEVTPVYERLFELEETSREVVQKENKWGRPPETVEGFIVIDETSQSVEEDFKRTEAGDASGLPDYLKDARPGHTASLHKQSACSPKRTMAQIVYSEGSNHRNTPVTGGQQTAAKEPLPLMPEVRRNPSNRSQKSQTQQRNEKKCATSCGKEGCRAPFDDLVNIVVSIVLLVLILLWLLTP